MVYISVYWLSFNCLQYICKMWNQCFSLMLVWCRIAFNYFYISCYSEVHVWHFMDNYPVTIKNRGTSCVFGPVIPMTVQTHRCSTVTIFCPEVFKQVFALCTGPGKIAFIFKSNPMPSIGFRLDAERDSELKRRKIIKCVYWTFLLGFD